MRAGTGFHADQRPRQIRRVGKQLWARKLLADDHARVTIERNEMKDSLAEIDSDRSNSSSVHAMILLVAQDHPTSGLIRTADHLINPYSPNQESQLRRPLRTASLFDSDNSRARLPPLRSSMICPGNLRGI